MDVFSFPLLNLFFLITQTMEIHLLVVKNLDVQLLDVFPHIMLGFSVTFSLFKRTLIFPAI